MPETLVEVEGLEKRFGATVAVDGLSFAIHAGECLGLLGPNGAGKTTTLEILEGLQSQTAGAVRLFGHTWAKDAERIRPRIGIQLQSTQFYSKVTVQETLDLFRSFYAEGLEPDALLARVALEEKRHAYCDRLSGGQRQRLSLAVALVSDPALLFLDEPTTGLDPQARRALWDLIQELKGQGRTIVLTTHYMEEAERLCDRLLVIDRGRVVAQGSPAELIATLGGQQVIELVTRPALPPDALATVTGILERRDGSTGTHLSVSELHVTLPQVVDAVRRAGVELTHLSTRHASLDDVFLKLTGRSLREEAA